MNHPPFNAVPSASDLVRAAMRACDHWNDTPAAREEMRRDCLATPADLRSDLIDHFRETYP